jgi:hypothetical protein
MIEVSKVTRLIVLMQRLIKTLERNQELTLHRAIDQFYYMQKSEELRVLLDNFEHSKLRMETIATTMDCHYREIFCQWRKDVRKVQPLFKMNPTISEFHGKE